MSFSTAEWRCGSQTILPTRRIQTQGVVAYIPVRTDCGVSLGPGSRSRWHRTGGFPKKKGGVSLFDSPPSEKAYRLR